MPNLDGGSSLFLLSVVLAYAYAFIGGFTDAANAIATAVGTRAFSPLQAVVFAGICELFGALTGTAVALTIGQGIVDREVLSQGSVCAALLATMSWSLITFWKGLPVSETHGLVGGIVGAGLAAGGLSVVRWSSLVPVLAAIIVSPLLGFVGAVGLLAVIYRLFARVERARTHRLFLNLQRLSALYMAFSHGRNDAQKPMGVLVLALATHWGWQTLRVPLWVVLSMALVAALGVASGGWRIIRTLGMRLTGLRTVQGFAAEASAATVLQIASALAIPVSTTHAITSAIIGAGTVHGQKNVRWRVVGEIDLLAAHLARHGDPGLCLFPTLAQAAARGRAVLASKGAWVERTERRGEGRAPLNRGTWLAWTIREMDGPRRFLCCVLVLGALVYGEAADAEAAAEAGGKHGLYVGVEGKLTRLAGRAAGLMGLHVGWTLDEVFVFGIGADASVERVVVRDAAGDAGRLGIIYGNLRAGYVFLPQAPLHPVALLLFGAGGVSSSAADGTGAGSAVFMLEPTLELEAAPPAWRFLRAGVAVSYRAVVRGEVGGVDAADLSGPTASAFLRLGLF